MKDMTLKALGNTLAESTLRLGRNRRHQRSSRPRAAFRILALRLALGEVERTDENSPQGSKQLEEIAIRTQATRYILPPITAKNSTIEDWLAWRDRASVDLFHER